MQPGSSELMNEIHLQVAKLIDKFVPDYYKSVDVDEGWHRIVLDCDNELTQMDPDYRIAQIKQKFGGLRYYFETSNPDDLELFAKMSSIVLKYEAIAAATCEDTGKPGVLMKSKGAWYKTLDPEYAKTTLFFKNYTIVDRKANQ